VIFFFENSFRPRGRGGGGGTGPGGPPTPGDCAGGNNFDVRRGAGPKGGGGGLAGGETLGVEAENSERKAKFKFCCPIVGKKRLDFSQTGRVFWASLFGGGRNGGFFPWGDGEKNPFRLSPQGIWRGVFKKKKKTCVLLRNKQKKNFERAGGKFPFHKKKKKHWPAFKILLGPWGADDFGGSRFLPQFFFFSGRGIGGGEFGREKTPALKGLFGSRAGGFFGRDVFLSCLLAEKRRGLEGFFFPYNKNFDAFGNPTRARKTQRTEHNTKTKKTNKNKNPVFFLEKKNKKKNNKKTQGISSEKKGGSGGGEKGAFF